MGLDLFPSQATLRMGIHVRDAPVQQIHFSLTQWLWISFVEPRDQRFNQLHLFIRRECFGEFQNFFGFWCHGVLRFLYCIILACKKLAMLNLHSSA